MNPAIEPDFFLLSRELRKTSFPDFSRGFKTRKIESNFAAVSSKQRKWRPFLFP